MKVLVAAISFSSKISGIQRHAFNLVRCLLVHPDITVVHLVIAPWQREMLRNTDLEQESRLQVHIAQLQPDPISRNLWHYRGLPKLANRLRPDLIHLTYPTPINRSALRCAVVITLHDLYPYEIPANFHFPRVIFNRLILRQALRDADGIACVSDATLLRLKQFAPVHICRKAVRIYNCVEAGAESSSVPELCGNPFLLCVAQHRYNKNIPLLIRVYAKLLSQGAIHSTTALVIVGIAGPETTNIHQTVAQHSLIGHVLFRAGLLDAELQWCYERCDALVVPSIIEGFGLPVAEGLLAGSRVICSDIAVLREVGGDHCQYFSLGRDEETALANSITTSLKSPRLPPVALPRLSGEAIAAEQLTFYRAVRERYLARATSSQARGELQDNSALREV